jgi:hypothetical protein
MGILVVEILQPKRGLRGMGDDVLILWQLTVKIIRQLSQKVDAISKSMSTSSKPLLVTNVAI